MRITNSHVGWGRVSVNESSFCGHDELLPNCCMALDGWDVIGAHAPSWLEMELADSYEIVGFLNGTAKWERGNPVEFWISGNYVGTVGCPAETTRPVTVPPGAHQFHAIPVAGRTEWRHSGWALRRVKAKPRSLAVVVIACWPERDICSHLDILSRSARKQGVWLDVFGVGEPYESHVNNKLLKLRKWIADLPLEVERVVYIDGKDSLFLGGQNAIEAAFATFGGPIVMSAEACCSPSTSFEFASWFPQQHAGRNWPCAGAFMGERRQVMLALDILSGLQERHDADAEKFFHRYIVPTCDQYHWHAAYLMGVVPMVIDPEFRLFGSVMCEKTHDESDQNSWFHFSDRKLTVKSSGASPPVVHFGPAFEICRDRWAGLSGALEP